MEKVNFGYSLKNIPIPTRDEHIRGTINKAEEFMQRMRWRVYHYENPSVYPIKEKYGFKTTRNAPPSPNLSLTLNMTLNIYLPVLNTLIKELHSK